MSHFYFNEQLSYTWRQANILSEIFLSAETSCAASKHILLARIFKMRAEKKRGENIFISSSWVTGDILEGKLPSSRQQAADASEADASNVHFISKRWSDACVKWWREWKKSGRERPPLLDKFIISFSFSLYSTFFLFTRYGRNNFKFNCCIWYC